MEFDWSDKHKVGVEPFDNQHDGMMTIIKKMDELAESGGDGKDWIELLDELIDFSSKHFAEEEEALEKSGYPELYEHQDEHRNLLNELNEIRARQDIEGARPSVEVAEFLGNWMSVHVSETDMRYREYFNK